MNKEITLKIIIEDCDSMKQSHINSNRIRLIVEKEINKLVWDSGATNSVRVEVVEVTH